MESPATCWTIKRYWEWFIHSWIYQQWSFVSHGPPRELPSHQHLLPLPQVTDRWCGPSTMRDQCQWWPWRTVRSLDAKEVFANEAGGNGYITSWIITMLQVIRNNLSIEANMCKQKTAANTCVNAGVYSLHVLYMLMPLSAFIHSSHTHAHTRASLAESTTATSILNWWDT